MARILQRNAIRRWALRFVPGLFVVAAVGCGGASDSAGAAVPKHIVLVSLDTVRADHLACYGHPTIETPNLDGIAEEGIVCRDVSAAAPSTLSSHVSLLTGLLPTSHGVVRNGFSIPREDTSLATILHDRGWHTAAVVGSFALSSLTYVARGFERFDEEFDPSLSQPSADGTREPSQRRADRVTDRAIEFVNDFVDDDGEAEGLFLFVHYFDAHHPYDPPAPWDRRYGKEAAEVAGDLADQRRAVAAHHQRILGEVPGLDRVLLQGLPKALLMAPPAQASPLERGMAARYAGEISYLDQELGRLFDHLRAEGLWEDTLVVVTSDHGETFWEHGDFWNHGLCVYDTTLRVPLILKLPGGGHAGEEIERPLSNVDVVPTVLELLELDGASELDGVSMVDAWGGGDSSRDDGKRLIFSAATQPPALEARTPGPWKGALKARSVRRGRWKFVHTPYLDHQELYDLEADPEERENLLLGDDDRAFEVAAELRAVLDASVRNANPPQTFFAHVFPGEPARADLSIQEQIRLLEQLGYVPGNEGEAPR